MTNNIGFEGEGTDFKKQIHKQYENTLLLKNVLIQTLSVLSQIIIGLVHECTYKQNGLMAIFHNKQFIMIALH
jgi:hypothetical protein